MDIIAQKIYPEHYKALYKLLHSICYEQADDIEAQLEFLREQCSVEDNESENIQSLFFLEAIQKRIEDDYQETGNLYLTLEQGQQQIEMFNLMAEKFPLVRLGQDIVNSACLRVASGAEELLILDIGIGTGKQVSTIVNQLVLSQPALKHVTVIGVEPAFESLEQAKNTLEKIALEKGISFQFLGLLKAVESLTKQDFEQIEDTVKRVNGPLILNASFSLHHIKPLSRRPELFSQFKKLQPALFTLIEPYANFTGKDVLERYTHAWHHYGLTFSAIDQINASLEEKNAIKRLFFSREIQDVLSPEAYRTEQFETGEMWAKRLIEAGFSMGKMPESALNISLPAFVSISQREGYIGLDIKGYPIISILCAY